MAANFSQKLMLHPGKKVKLASYDPDATLGWQKGRKAKESLEKAVAKLDDLQYLLYAEGKRALLIVFQGMDASGKDGTIRHVMAGINPQGCRVTSFKEPSAEEKAHDFLWRIHAAAPKIGEFGVFNRSHYEDVLVVRVHNLVPKDIWSQRYDQINKFEGILTANNVLMLKFFLHISKDEQKRRLEQRIQDPMKNWKIAESDFAERRHWGNYVEAYEDALSKCSTKHAPWYIIPANKKWFRNLAVSQIIEDRLRELKMKYPPPKVDLTKIKIE
jgi:PPK2 family polyphosphate:nucleotide phosphotransferase